MIAPKPPNDDLDEIEEDLPPPPDVVPWTRDILGEGGHLARAMAAEGGTYEFRPQQLEMAEAFSQLLEDGGHLAVEAGTGVGKSFAYLVPLIQFAVQQQCQVVVSTYTISLQEQLIYKDLPFLRKHLGLDFDAVLMKGMSNYLCLRRLDRTRRAGADLLKRDQEQELEDIRQWSLETQEGSLQDLRNQPSYEVWDQVSVEPGNCLWQKCPEYSKCFFMKARKQVMNAQIIVVNHHILFADLALQSMGGGMLPAHACLVVDEAHHMEAVASDHLGIRLSQRSFEYWLRRLFTADGSRGLFKLTQNGPGAQSVSKMYEHVALLFSDIQDWADFRGPSNKKVIHEALPIKSQVLPVLGQLLRWIELDMDQQKDDEVRAELNSALRRGKDLRTQLSAFLEQSLEDQIYWIELTGKHRKYIALHSAPIEVGPYLQDRLFEQYERLMMTSATLAVGEDMGYFTRRIGAESADTLQVGSPFDFQQQMTLQMSKSMPEPGRDDQYAEALAKILPGLIEENDGDAFVLFTSDRLMRRTADRVRFELQQQDRRLYVQGTSLSRHAMLEAFIEDSGSVLFGLDSFWTGVDVRGDALRMVVITRLPFTVPDQPLVQARMQRIRERGGDPFREYSLPEALLKFRQGVGRLIRTASDRGTVVILDPRIHRKPYGRLFLKSLPECPVEWIP